jgi:hypothetical protein
MIRLSMEIPTHWLRVWTSRTDLDFVLAHRVLEDGTYAEFHANREKGRELILDNSMHELGHPLPVKDIIHAARAVKANYVIPPDKLGYPDFNLDQFWSMVSSVRGEFPLAPVVCGHTQAERLSFIEEVSEHASMICLPYREARFDWYQELSEAFSNWDRIHLLGVNTLGELHSFAMISECDPARPRRWSVDTAKAIKWGVEMRGIDDGDSLRHASLSSKDLLDLRELNPAQLMYVNHNIEILRLTCA